MRIATWNVNSIKARQRYLLGWLEAREPDLVCLQELKVSDDKFAHQDFSALGYYAYVHGQRQYNGVAILTREPAEVLTRGLPGAENQGARLLTVRHPELVAVSVYVPNGKSLDHEDFGHKLRFLSCLRDYLETLDRAGTVLIGGDFNLTPGDLDTHSPALEGQIHHSPEERRQLDSLLQLGLYDLYRQTDPEGRMFSWWDYRGGAFHKNLGLRIDLLLGSRALLDRVSSIWVDRDYRKKQDGEKPSDHAPVIADLK